MRSLATASDLSLSHRLVIMRYLAGSRSRGLEQDTALAIRVLLRTKGIRALVLAPHEHLCRISQNPLDHFSGRSIPVCSQNSVSPLRCPFWHRAVTNTRTSCQVFHDVPLSSRFTFSVWNASAACVFQVNGNFSGRDTS
jgi:hypothetical protein